MFTDGNQVFTNNTPNLAAVCTVLISLINLLPIEGAPINPSPGYHVYIHRTLLLPYFV